MVSVKEKNDMNKSVHDTGGMDTQVIKRIFQLSVLGIASLGATGCGVLASHAPWSDQSAGTVDYTQVSANLIDAISQYAESGAASETYVVAAADSAFERQVYNDMESLGYILASNGEDINVSAATDGSQASVPGATLFELSIGQVSAEREFIVRDGKTVPVSEMVIKASTEPGSEPAIVLNDAEIFDSVDAGYSTVLFNPDVQPVEEEQSVSKISSKGSAEVEPLIVARAPKRNLYENQLVSNYAPVFEDFQEIDRSVLIFPNDSLRMGETNKSIIEKFAASMNQDTDVLSIIGCSHGTTEINNGNALLALGRANRVKEALMFTGVEHDLLLEEGCWAPYEFSEKLPARGVILTLKRRADS